MNTMLLLFLEFFKIGLFAVGGGLAALPFLYELEERYHWFTKSDVANMIAISESTPGPITINMATYVGFETEGVLGSIVATVANIIPEIIVVLIVAKFLSEFSENRYVKAAFYGIRPTVCALIAAALFSVVKITLLNWDAFTASLNPAVLIDWLPMGLFAVFLWAVLKYKKHPVVYILLGAVCGLIFKL